MTISSFSYIFHLLDNRLSRSDPVDNVIHLLNNSLPPGGEQLGPDKSLPSEQALLCESVNIRIISGMLLCCEEKANQMQDEKTASCSASCRFVPCGF